VLNALSANRRDFQTNKENTELGLADYDDRFSELSPSNFDGKYFADDVESDKVKTGSDESKHEVKPQAMFRPYLFVQERSNQSGRRGSKASAAAEIIKLAQERDIPVEYVDKGILNTLSGNRPHQGFVLRCGKLTFKSLSRIPAPNPDDRNDKPSIWLVLDEIVDPQNLGALLRSAYFLGGGSRGSLGVLVCSKNSAPPSPIVSSASAGALELLDVFSTNNLPRTLSQACEDGFRVIGASSSVPTQQISNFERRQTSDDDDSDGADYDNSLETGLSLSSTPILYDLQDLPIRLPDKDGNDRPILLVLGSEGQGLRNLVAKACTEFVRIPPGFASSIQAENGDNNEESDETEAGVDSLNVSVSAGIMLWHLLSGSK
jgi:21S rRNA (GM2251-2'-O)-methyltransferase